MVLCIFAAYTSVTLPPPARAHSRRRKRAGQASGTRPSTRLRYTPFCCAANLDGEHGRAAGRYEVEESKSALESQGQIHRQTRCMYGRSLRRLHMAF